MLNSAWCHVAADLGRGAAHDHHLGERRGDVGAR